MKIALNFLTVLSLLSLVIARNNVCPLVQENEKNCVVIAPNPRPGQVSGVGAFEYATRSRNGPRNWGNLDCKNGRFAKFSGCSYCKNTCGGNRQSPINIRPSTAVTRGRIRAPRLSLSHRAPLKFEVTPDNFELKCMRSGRCGSTLYKGRRFQLDNVHMHHFSEHRLNGRKFELEMHMVHKNGDDLLVLGLFIRLGRHNHEVQRFLNIARRRCFGVINLRRLTTRSFRPRKIVSYIGSTTTPPCSEGRTWIVSTKPITVSRRQLNMFKVLTADNVEARPVQPLNGRDIVSYKW